MIKDDGDIVRGLGFVTLYAAYLEEQIDSLLTELHPIQPYDEKAQRWQISRKIKRAMKIIWKLDGQAFSVLVSDLEVCLEMFEKRNELIHGRIYGGFNRPRTLRSGRRNIPDREVSSQELYELANAFFDFRGAVYGPTIFRIPRAINEYLRRA